MGSSFLPSLRHPFPRFHYSFDCHFFYHYCFDLFSTFFGESSLVVEIIYEWRVFFPLYFSFLSSFLSSFPFLFSFPLFSPLTLVFKNTHIFCLIEPLPFLLLFILSSFILIEAICQDSYRFFFFFFFFFLEPHS